MTPSAAALQARARRRLARLERGWRDPRYARVVGRLRGLGLLVTNFELDDPGGPIRIADALWAGNLEPRILELLPALVVKAPSTFEDVRELPSDLGAAVRALRRGEVPADFRGIPGAAVARWLPRVGRREKLPSCMKTFRLRHDDLQLLRNLASALELSETDVVRRALRALASAELLD
jgi:hypothetical protein